MMQTLLLRNNVRMSSLKNKSPMVEPLDVVSRETKQTLDNYLQLLTDHNLFHVSSANGTCKTARNQSIDKLSVFEKVNSECKME